MSNLRFFIDSKAIASEFGDLRDQVNKELDRGVKQLASMTYAKTLEMAQSELHSLREVYVNALEYKEVAPNVWVVSLDESALFIEEGKKAGSMLDDLLKNNAKTAKDGSKYKVIPFEHSKKPSQTPRSAQHIVNQVKAELRYRGIPYKKIENNPDGSPRLGKIHTIKDIVSFPPTARSSHGSLDNLTIYQRKGPNGKVQRDIMTFRVASSKHAGSKWIHPGLPAKKFMDKSLEWAVKVWDTEILPAIMERFK